MGEGGGEGVMRVALPRGPLTPTLSHKGEGIEEFASAQYVSVITIQSTEASVLIEKMA